jgi:hypothetical protein
VAIDILGNDSDPEGNLDPSSLSETTPAANGSVSFTPTGAAIYTPDVGFTGTDTFEYEVCDLAGQCATAMVTVVVDDPLVNEPPVAGDDSAETSIDVPISISPLGNDVDPEDDPLVIDPTTGITSAPTSGGTAVVETDGTITYTPAPGFTGTDTFEYEVCDPSGECDTAEVTIDVNGPPITDDESVTTDPGTPVDIDVVDGDVDPDGAIDPTSVSIVTPPTNGTVAVDPATGVVTYTPEDGYGGPDSFVYEVCDNDGLCAEGNVTIAVPFPPVAVDDTAAADENTPVDIPVVDNDTDADGTIDPTSVMIVTLPSSGTVSVDGTTGVVTYTPDAGFSGVDSFVYEVCDNDGFCDQADIDVSVNGVPIVKDDESMTNEDVPVAIDVLVNDTDVDGIDPTTVSIDSNAANGTLTIDPVTGAITYTPNPGFHGLDAFMYEVCDNVGLCNTASVAIDVNANPDPVDDTAWTPQDTPVVVPVVANDVDPDSPVDPTSVSIVDIPSNGSLTVNSATGEMTYTPNDGFYGTDTFTYRICDDLGACGEATVTVDVDGAPITQPDTVFTTLANPVDVDVLANDTDPDSALDPTSLAIIDPPVNGTTTVLAGMVTYTPNDPITAQDSFMYQICDVEGVCSSETAYVNPTLVRLSGRVFYDANRDGELGLGEGDISGVALSLFAPGADGVLGTADDALVDTASTASPYVFEDVLAGDYLIVMDTSTLPNVVYATDDADGGADRSIAVTVATGDISVLHFGEVAALLTGILTDEDGAPLAGAIVTLTDADGNVFEMLTADDGSYRFEGIPGSRPLVAGVGTLQVEHKGTTATFTVSVNGADVTVRNLVIEIVEAPPALAFTGASIGRLAALALLLILLGFAMLSYDRPALAWRRRED